MESVRLDGAAQLRAALMRAPARALFLLGGALYIEANGMMTESQGEVPVDEGTLKASGVVMMPRLSGSLSVEVSFGYGGAARAYALIQHERTDFNHRVGKDHYLSDPVNRRMAGIEARLAATVATLPLFPGLP